jgi:hypothetical protein
MAGNVGRYSGIIVAITGQCQMSDAHAIKISITCDPFKRLSI